MVRGTARIITSSCVGMALFPVCGTAGSFVTSSVIHICDSVPSGMIPRSFLLCNKPEGVKQPFYFAHGFCGSWVIQAGHRAMACHSSLMGKMRVLGWYHLDVFPPVSGSYLAGAGTSGGSVARTPTWKVFSAWSSPCVLIRVPSQYGAVFLMGV